MKSALWILVLTAAVAVAQQGDLPAPNDVIEGPIQKEGATEGAITRPVKPVPSAGVYGNRIKQIDQQSFKEQMENRLAQLDSRIADIQMRMEQEDSSGVRYEKIVDIEKRRAKLGSLMEELGRSKGSTWEKAKSKVTAEATELEGRIARVNDQLKK